MYSVSVRDHLMIAHSFQRRGVRAGAAAARRDLRRRRRVPAPRARRRRHRRRHRPRQRGAAADRSAALNFRNLDDDAGVHRPEHDHRVSGARRLRSDGRGHRAAASSVPARTRIESMRVTLHESHVASASFEGRRRRRRLDMRSVVASSFPAGSTPGPAATNTTGALSRACARRLVGRRPRAERQRSRADRRGREQAARSRSPTCRPRELVVVDGLALGAMPVKSSGAASRLRLVALVHHPLALETGLPDGCGRDARRERAPRACVRAGASSSRATRRPRR